MKKLKKLTKNFSATHQSKEETNQTGKWFYYPCHHQSVKAASHWLFTDSQKCLYSAFDFKLSRQQIIFLFCLARKCRRPRKEGSSKESDSYQPSMKDKTIKKCFLLKNVILVQPSWFTDVYKESYSQKTINTALFQYAKKHF